MKHGSMMSLEGNKQGQSIFAKKDSKSRNIPAGVGGCSITLGDLEYLQENLGTQQSQLMAQRFPSLNYSTDRSKTHLRQHHTIDDQINMFRNPSNNSPLKTINEGKASYLSRDSKVNVNA